MLRVDRAKVIRNKVLGVQNDAWSFESSNKFRAAVNFQNDWQAQIWTDPSWITSDGGVTEDKDTFLDECRKQNCPHTLDLWVNGMNKVLSAHWEGTGCELISIRRGIWETILFGLPLPKSRSSFYYFAFEARGGVSPMAQSEVQILDKSPRRLH